MEATVVKIGSSLGFKVPEDVIRNFNLTAGSKIEINLIRDSEFTQYTKEGEGESLLPDFLDSEIDDLM